MKIFRIVFAALAVAALGACADTGPTNLTAPDTPSFYCNGQAGSDGKC